MVVPGGQTRERVRNSAVARAAVVPEHTQCDERAWRNSAARRAVARAVAVQGAVVVEQRVWERRTVHRGRRCGRLLRGHRYSRQAREMRRSALVPSAAQAAKLGVRVLAC